MNSDKFMTFGYSTYANPVNGSGFAAQPPRQEIYLDRKTPFSAFAKSAGLYTFIKDEYGGSRGFGGEDAYFSFSIFGDENLTQKLAESSEIILPSRPLQFIDSTIRLDENSTTYLNEGDEFTAILPKLGESAISSVYWEITGNGVGNSDFVGLSELNGVVQILEGVNRRMIFPTKKDDSTEGQEQISLKIYSDNSKSNLIGTKTYKVMDTSKSHPYIVNIFPRAYINEGTTFEIDIKVRNDSSTTTTLYYSIESRQDLNSSDLTCSGVRSRKPCSVDLNGSFAVESSTSIEPYKWGGVGLIIKARADQRTEGNESFDV